MPEISKEDFHGRLKAVLDNSKQSGQVDSSQAPQAETGNSAAAGAQESIQSVTSTPTAPPQPQPEARPVASAPQTRREPSRPVETARQPKPQQKEEKPVRTSSQISQKGEEQKSSQSKKPEKKTVQERKDTPKSSKPEKKVDDTESRPKIPPGPPTQYRLQVRLFDGSSVRSSFAPSQTISRDVRPWLDQQMAENHPYNLKHILTPLPNRNLTIADEEQSLQAFLNLSATANLVMVPIQTYTEAYSGAGSSLPVRAVSAAYDMATSAVGSASGYVGSFLGFGQTTPATAASSSSTTSTEPRSQGPGRPAASRGPIIRTLADQRREQGDSQLYNGNQVCVLHCAQIIFFCFCFLTLSDMYSLTSSPVGIQTRDKLSFFTRR